MLPSATDELASIGFRDSKHVRDLGMRIVEGFVENVGARSFGRELLQQYQHREL
jgi:hypothetical protein